MNVEEPEHETIDRKQLGAEESDPRAGPDAGNLWRGLHLLPAGRTVFVRSHLGARAGGFVCLGSPGNRGQIEEAQPSATISVLMVA